MYRNVIDTIKKNKTKRQSNRKRRRQRGRNKKEDTFGDTLKRGKAEQAAGGVGDEGKMKS